MSENTEKLTTKETNYYLQQRYLSAELNTDKISFEPDSSNRMYNDNSQDSFIKHEQIIELDKCFQENEELKQIIDNLPLEKTIYLSIPEANKIYQFCDNLLKTNKHLSILTKVEMFSLLTEYINLNEKETKYFYDNLSNKFKSDLIKELRNNKLYKNNRLF
jgi:hypothetical protein